MYVYVDFAENIQLGDISYFTSAYFTTPKQLQACLCMHLYNSVHYCVTFIHTHTKL